MAGGIRLVEGLIFRILPSVLCDTDHKQESASPEWRGWLVRGIWCIVIGYLTWLGVLTALRISFPWDLSIWPESPFMTNMLKMDRGEPLYSTPSAANSFVYSPGLEYLTFAILKPFRAHLDIRYCRAINVLIGLAAGGIAGVFIYGALRILAPNFRSRGFAMLGTGVAVLVIFRNFTSDTTHPDNLVMLHTAGLFLLTQSALQKGSFRLALATMLFAGSGVLAKQILFGAFVGPAILFWCFGPWGGRKSCLLAVLGGVASIGALVILWRQPFAKFYTFEVLARQGMNPFQLYWMMLDSLHGDRAILWCLAPAGIALLWVAGRTARRFVIVWLVLGACSVWPNAMSYLKQMGTWNNLIIFQLWLLLLVWPAVGVWLSQATTSSTELATRDTRWNLAIGSLVVAFVVLLLPTRLPLNRSIYSCCDAVQKRVTADLRAGLKVLVAQGTMYQIRAGFQDVPLDRAISNLELQRAGLASRSGTAGRIHERYYDRIYLAEDDFYPGAVLAEIEKNYAVDTVVVLPPISDRVELGRSLKLIGDCKILSRRKPSSETTPGTQGTDSK